MGSDDLETDSGRFRTAGDDPLSRRLFDPAGASVSRECITAVATYEGTNPVELPAFAETIDPDALDALFESLSGGTSRESSGRVIFDYAGYTIDVQSDGTLGLYSRGERPPE